jgi:outer membrane protein
MKKLLLGALMAFGILSASAQTKIGYISLDELMSVMPEAKTINADLVDYQNSLGEMGKNLEKDFEKKRDQYFKDSLTLTPTMKEIRRDELQKLIARLQGYDQEAQDKVNQYAQGKIAPVQAKALEAIKAVAKEKGYGYVIDDTNKALLVAPAGDDLLPFVKTKLGIKDPVPAK